MSCSTQQILKCILNLEKYVQENARYISHRHNLKILIRDASTDNALLNIQSWLNQHNLPAECRTLITLYLQIGLLVLIKPVFKTHTNSIQVLLQEKAAACRDLDAEIAVLRTTPQCWEYLNQFNAFINTAGMDADRKYLHIME